jgi:hypothetical protein
LRIEKRTELGARTEFNPASVPRVTVPEEVASVTDRLRRVLPAVVFGLAVLTPFAGCGRREFAEVEGVVTLNGKAIAGIEVHFLPDPEKGNRGNTSSGLTDRQGRYRLRNDRDDKDGTVLGMHRVLLIDSYANRDPAGLTNKPSRIPTAYAEAAQTPLRDVEIKPGKQQLDFEVKDKLP